MGVLRRWGERLTKTPTSAEAEELQADSRNSGATAIDQLADRQVATVCGVIRAVTLRPRSTVPALEVELYDGSQSLVLVWLGRRRIHGIEPGVKLRATGRVSSRDGVPTIFNPAYDLLPRRIP